MSTTEQSSQEILDVVAAFIRDVIDEDWASDVSITMDTSFANDLELESIEIVALSEKLHEHFGESLDLAGWLSGKELDEIIQL